MASTLVCSKWEDHQLGRSIPLNLKFSINSARPVNEIYKAGAEWTDFNDTGNQFLLLSWLSEIRICFKELEAVFNLALEE